MPRRGDVKLKTWKGYNKDIKKSQEANHRRYKRWKKKNPKQAMLSGCKCSAQKKGVVFSLTIEDIIIPEVCPVLGIPLIFGNKRTDNTPSVDRIDNDKGYTADNIVIVSWRANILKRDATVEELEKIAKFYRAVKVRKEKHGIRNRERISL
jgi:hypothetical protein